MAIQVFEVDPSIPNPDDLKSDKVAAMSARDRYLKDQAGPLTILPNSVCYLPLSHFVPSGTFATLALNATSLHALDSVRGNIIQRRFQPSQRLGQIEYIFDLGNWSPYFIPDPAEGKKYGTMLQILQYPFSIGGIHIGTRDAATQHKPLSGLDKPVIDPRYYQGPHGQLDLDIMV